MRVLIAPDKFAGTLTAVQAAEAIAAGWLAGAPDDVVVQRPVADGGPGFLEVLHNDGVGHFERLSTTGPLGEPISARILVDGDFVYVEAAEACGLHLLPPQGRDAERATTAGVADLLSAALAHQPSRVLVGVGGTATTDGGAGLIDRWARTHGSWPASTELLIATDVDNPLLGVEGAAAVFGPQKGASASAVQRLDAKLTRWAAECGSDPTVPGAGAGGGLGYGLMVLGGHRVPGIDTCLDAVGFDHQVGLADLVISGEGAFDFQSLRGKVVSGVAQRAAAAAKPCVVIAGRVDVGRREAASAGITESWSVVDHVGSADEAMAHPAEHLTSLAQRVARQWRQPLA